MLEAALTAIALAIVLMGILYVLLMMIDEPDDDES